MYRAYLFWTLRVPANDPTVISRQIENPSEINILSTKNIIGVMCNLSVDITAGIDFIDTYVTVIFPSKTDSVHEKQNWLKSWHINIGQAGQNRRHIT